MAVNGIDFKQTAPARISSGVLAKARLPIGAPPQTISDSVRITLKNGTRPSLLSQGVSRLASFIKETAGIKLSNKEKTGSRNNEVMSNSPDAENEVCDNDNNEEINIGRYYNEGNAAGMGRFFDQSHEAQRAILEDIIRTQEKCCKRLKEALYGKAEDKQLEKLINKQLKKFEELKTLLIKAQILSTTDPAAAKALLASIKEMVASLIAGMSSILKNTNLSVKVETNLENVLKELLHMRRLA